MLDFIRMLAEVAFYRLIITFCLFIVLIYFNTQSKIILISSEIVSHCPRSVCVSCLAGVYQNNTGHGLTHVDGRR